jgi:uncharacterized protein (TIGR02145 family)
MKIFLFLVSLFFVLKSSAQNYLIDFAGSGASTTVGSVKVENITAGKSITINGSDILHLTVITGVTSPEYNQPAQLKIYPNPMIDCSTLEIFPPAPGDAVISIIDLSGRQIGLIQTYLGNYRQAFRLSGVQKGFFIVNVQGNGYQLSEKFVSNGNSGDILRIEQVNNRIESIVKEKTLKYTKETQSTVDMAYSDGDRLKFTGISGDYRTVIVDIPSGNKTIMFNFNACTDGDNNNYPVVAIGTQVCMAENLKTTRYRNRDLIGTTTPATLDISGENTPEYQWTYDGDEINVAIYGRSYTWYATVDIRNVCPDGWAVPTDDQWTTLTDYLTDNSFGYEGSGDDIAKSLAATWGWTEWIEKAGAIGYNIAENNSSGFTALPGGYRYRVGQFFGKEYCSYWWSSTESSNTTAWSRSMDHNHSLVYRQDLYYKGDGLSVRCIRVL